jgi:hypothetical protein
MSENSIDYSKYQAVIGLEKCMRKCLPRVKHLAQMHTTMAQTQILLLRAN